MLLNSLLPIALHYTIFLQGLFILNRCPGESYNVKHSVIFLQIFFDLVRQINRKQDLAGHQRVNAAFCEQALPIITIFTIKTKL